MSDQDQKQENPQEEKNKVEKRYQSLLGKMNAVLSGDTSVFTTKVSNGAVAEAVSKMIKKRKEAAIDKFTEDMTALVDKKIALDREIVALQKQTEEAIQKKKKEFCDEADKVNKTLENVDKLASEYAKTLAEGQNAPEQVQ